MKINLIIFAFFISLLSLSLYVKAETSCKGRIYLHYHRYENDYDLVELIVKGNGYSQNIYNASKYDQFGQIYEIPVCRDADDNIIISIQGKDNTPYKDGVDLDQDGIIDDKVLDVSDVKYGGVKHVYLLQGANLVYDDLNPQGGKLFVIYYDPTNSEVSEILVQGMKTKHTIPFKYTLGLDQSDSDNLFKVAIIDINPSNDEQFSFIIRNDKYDKDINWITQLSNNELDRFGNLYKLNGERLINISDILYGGYKFIYLIKGEKTIYTDYKQFLEQAFPLEIISATFPSKRTVSVHFNKPIGYDGINQFKLLDNDGEEIEIEKIAYNAFKLMDNKFNLLLRTDIDAKKEYVITYVYEKDGEIQELETEVTLGFTISEEEGVNKEIKYPIIISGVIVISTIVTLLVILKRNK